MAVKLRPQLTDVLSRLLAHSELTRAVTLDEVGEALGTLSVSTDEIDALLSELERHDREIITPAGAGLEALLGRVIAAARALKSEGVSRPSIAEVSARAALTREQVFGALSLLHIMQR